MDLFELQRDFINLRLGTFIHYNSATAQFHSDPEIEDWEYGAENGGLPRRFPFDGKKWDPRGPDCAAWAETAASAGCRFAAYTAKHHEGFCTWPTAFTEHCVRSASNRTDVVRSYLEAFRAKGIVAGLYFSILDLTAGICRKSCTPEQKRLIFGELTELLTDYGEIPFLMVDGWNSPWGGPSFDMLPFEEVDGLVKSLQPKCLLLNIGWNRDTEKSDAVFYENGAGQKLDGGFSGPGILCQKLTKTWFWRDTDPYTPCAPVEWAEGLMRECFPRNVNLMLNISPDVDGNVDDNLKTAFREFGKRVVFPDPLTEKPEGWTDRLGGNPQTKTEPAV